MLNPLKIMKNLTATKKSVYWTMQDGSEVVCRVATKGGGQKLVDLINAGVTDFVLEHLPKHRARYIAYQNVRLCRISIKAFHQLMEYLVGGVDALPNQLTKTTKKLINHDHSNSDCDQQPSYSNSSTSDTDSSTQKPSVWLEVDAQVDFGHAQPLLLSESLGNSDSPKQGSCVSSIQRFDPHVQHDDEFFAQLEKFDQKLRADVERGNSLIEQGTELVVNGAGIEREVGDDYIGTGQLVVRVANLRRDQLEIALDQRRLGIQMLEIGAGQIAIRAGQLAIRTGQIEIAEQQHEISLGIANLNRGIIRAIRAKSSRTGEDFSARIAMLEQQNLELEKDRALTLEIIQR